MIGNSEVTYPFVITSRKFLNRPPSFPTGNKKFGDPFMSLIFAFSGRPILAPIAVPFLSRISKLDSSFRKLRVLVEVGKLELLKFKFKSNFL